MLESLEINSHIYDEVVFNKDAKLTQGILKRGCDTLGQILLQAEVRRK